MARRCERPACGKPAEATLTYRYAHQSAWVDWLADEAHPAAYDLCLSHAETLRVPRGWVLEDRRTAVQALFRGPHGDALAS